MRLVIATAVALVSFLSPWDARAITVRIDAAPGSLENPSIAEWLTLNSSVGVSFVLSEPAPPGGLDIPTYSNMQPALASVHFDEGETQGYQEYSFLPSEQYFPLDDCWSFRLGYLSFTSLPPGIEAADPLTLHVFQVRAENTYCDCSSCWTANLMCRMTFGPDCSELLPESCTDIPPPASPRLSVDSSGGTRGSLVDAWFPALDVLTRYRDEILATTPEGQFYTDLYEQHSFDISLAIASSPFLIVELTFAKEAWIAGLDALLNGTGGQFVVTHQMQEDLLSILQKLEDVGTPALAEMIAFERERLALDSIAGLKMTQFQQRVENQGPVSVEGSSWGRVKGLYR